MSKTVRIKEHLYAEIEALAKTERRSLVAQLEILLEQALKLNPPAEPDVWPGAASPNPAAAAENHFKPDPKR